MSKVTTASPAEGDEPWKPANSEAGARDGADASAKEARSSFPRTTDSIWQQVHDASAGDAEAVGKLCVLYRPAILAYVRRWTRRPEDAEDLTQAFLAKVIEKNPFAGYQRRDTKFRSYLLRVLGNFLRDDHRGRRPESEPLDEEMAGGGAGVSALDVELALEVHGQTLQAMAEKHAAKGTSDRFTALEPFILGVDDRYSDLAGPLGMTPVHLRQFMFGLRESYHDGFRDAVSQMVTRGEIAGEMRYLLGLLAPLPPEVRNRKPGKPGKDSR